MTEEQQKIIESEKSLYVSATAGSGKTHTLSGSVLYRLQEKNVSPDKIKIFSFSRNAASEIRDRLKVSLDNSIYSKLMISTIHAFAYKIIKSHKSDFGYPKIDIRDDGYYYHLIEKFVFNDWEEANPDRKITEKEEKELKDFVNKTVKTVETMKAKNLPEIHLDNQIKDYPYIKTLYFKAKDYMTKKGYLTFIDLLYYSIPFLKDRPDLVKRYQAGIEYLYIDEGQDTSIVQIDFLDLFVNDQTKIYIFGDIKQTLYRFNYAEPHYLLAWAKKKNVDLATLSLTFRYGKEIADLSQRVVNNMEIPDEHKVYTRTIDGKSSPIHHKVFSTVEEKVSYILDDIQKKHEQGIPYHDMNILYRMNRLSINFQYELIKRQIPFFVSGALFLLRTEVKFLLELASFSEFFDRDSLSFISKTMGIGIDEGLINSLCDTFNMAYGREPKDIDELQEFFSETPIKGIGPSRQKNFFHLFAALTAVERVVASNSVTLFKDLMKITNLEQLPFASKVKLSEWTHRLGFLNYMDSIKQEGDFESVEDFINYLKLSSISNDEIELENKVYLGSIHSSKGSTMPVVYLLLDELNYNGSKPINPDDFDPDIDQGQGNVLLDELFVLFVGLTRTRDELHLVTSNTGIDTLNDLLYSGFDVAQNISEDLELLSNHRLQYNLINMPYRSKIESFHKLRQTEKAINLNINGRPYWIPKSVLGSDGESLFINRTFAVKQGILV